MFVPEDEAGEVREENSTVFERQDASPADASGSSVMNGEYHFNRDEYREQVYADAHFEPAEESTVPPRYYTPPERPVKEPKERTNEKSRSGLGLRLLFLALILCLLGGLVASLISSQRLSQRIDELETALNANTESIAAVSDRQQLVQESGASEGGTISPSEIYAMACEQAVGITTTVTTTNLFGMTVSAPVSGSGFIVSEDGYILTNYHVIEYAATRNLGITVMTYDGTEYEAVIVGTEEANDIAVLKIEASGLSPVTFGDSDTIQVGDVVYAVGNPLGELEFSMSTGHVSALDRIISTEEAESINMFQIDAAVNPGNSGGPVYNSLGQVIGIVTAKYSDTDVEGLGFAIPVNDASSIAEDLITKGYVSGKAYMGINVNTDYSAMYAQYWGTPMGAYVAEVTPGSCADQAGIQANDIITKLGDYSISDFSELKAALRHFSAGETAEVEVYHVIIGAPGEEVRGETRVVTITFDEAKPSAGN